MFCRTALTYRSIVPRNGWQGAKEKRQSGARQQCHAQYTKGVNEIPCSLIEVSHGQRAKVSSQSPDGVD
jgi:hypothetical protein